MRLGVILEECLLVLGILQCKGPAGGRSVRQKTYDVMGGNDRSKAGFSIRPLASHGICGYCPGASQTKISVL